MPLPPASPAVRRVSKRLADGSIKVYEYPALPTKRRAVIALPPDSIRELLAAYERSPEWANLATRTRRNHNIALRHLHAIQHLSVAGLRRRDILTLRDAIATGIGHGAANAFTARLGAILSWARDRGWIEYSPADRLHALPGGHFPSWSEDALAAALHVAPEPVRRALLMAVHTGQRRGDLVAARWSDLAGGVWRLTQEKTGRTLVVPLHPHLAAEIAAWRQSATAVTVLTNAAGTPWHRDALTMAVMRVMEETGRKGHGIHGLRKLAAVRLAEAGCSVHEIAAITGHATLKEISRYTEAVDQEKLARSALVRLQQFSDASKKRRNRQ